MPREGYQPLDWRQEKVLEAWRVAFGTGWNRMLCERLGVTHPIASKLGNNPGDDEKFRPDTLLRVGAFIDELFVALHVTERGTPTALFPFRGISDLTRARLFRESLKQYGIDVPAAVIPQASVVPAKSKLPWDHFARESQEKIRHGAYDEGIRQIMVALHVATHPMEPVINCLHCAQRALHALNRFGDEANIRDALTMTQAKILGDKSEAGKHKGELAMIKSLAACILSEGGACDFANEVFDDVIGELKSAGAEEVVTTVVRFQANSAFRSRPSSFDSAYRMAEETRALSNSKRHQWSVNTTQSEMLLQMTRDPAAAYGRVIEKAESCYKALDNLRRNGSLHDPRSDVPIHQYHCGAFYYVMARAFVDKAYRRGEAVDALANLKAFNGQVAGDLRMVPMKIPAVVRRALPGLERHRLSYSKSDSLRPVTRAALEKFCVCLNALMDA